MAGGGLTLIPSYAQDLVYPAYQDRLLVKSLILNEAGIVSEEDFKVSAGTGTQVNVKAGKAFVNQSAPTQEGGNTFYGGMYNVLNPVEQNPYNSVEILSANPQIAQIIVRVYDKEELGSTASSFARIEWLNGAANAGATKAHIEEGKAGEYGAAALPVSCLRLCYVLVPKTATKSSEFEYFDKRTVAGGLRVAPESKYSALTERVSGTEYLPSQTNSVQVCLTVYGNLKESDLTCQVYCGGVEIYNINLNEVPATAWQIPCGFTCPAGQKWKAVFTHATLKSSYLIM